MFEVSSPVKIVVDQNGEFTFVMSTGRQFDYSTPYRNILKDISSILECKAAVKLNLPPYEHGEDFVEGHMSIGQSTVKIYFEHALSYLSFSSDKRNCLEYILDEIRRHIKIVNNQSN